MGCSLGFSFLLLSDLFQPSGNLGGSGVGVGLQPQKTRIDEEIDSYTAKQHNLLNGHPFVPCSTTVLSLLSSPG